MPQQSTPIASGPAYKAQSSEPTDTAAIWIDTSDEDKVKYHNGSSWVALSADAQEGYTAAGYKTDGGEDWYDGSESTSLSFASGDTSPVDLTAIDEWCDGMRVIVTTNGSSDSFTIDIDSPEEGQTEVFTQITDGNAGGKFTFETTFTPQTVTKVIVKKNGTLSSGELWEVNPHVPGVGRHSHQ